MNYYVKVHHGDLNKDRWHGPFLTAHMAGCIAMGWDQGVLTATVHTAQEAASMQAESLKAATSALPQEDT